MDPNFGSRDERKSATRSNRRLNETKYGGALETKVPSLSEAIYSYYYIFCISWYQKIDFFDIKNPFLDINKSIFYIRKLNSSYQNNQILDIKKSNCF